MIVNTHIHWDPAFCDVKAMQVQMLLERVDELKRAYRCLFFTHLCLTLWSSRGAALPTIVCGDFNSIPSSAAYELLYAGSVAGSHEDFLNHDYGQYTKQGLSHKLDLRSAYKEVLGEEPSYTNYTGII